MDEIDDLRRQYETVNRRLRQRAEKAEREREEARRERDEARREAERLRDVAVNYRSQAWDGDPPRTLVLLPWEREEVAR